MLTAHVKTNIQTNLAHDLHPNNMCDGLTHNFIHLAWKYIFMLDIEISAKY